MSTAPGAPEKTVAEQEAQRAAEQEALRNVRQLTDRLEQEQQAQRRLSRYAWPIVVVAVAAVGYVAYTLYDRTSSVPPSGRIEVPPKVVVPQK